LSASATDRPNGPKEAPPRDWVGENDHDYNPCLLQQLGHKNIVAPSRLAAKKTPQSVHIDFSADNRFLHFLDFLASSMYSFFAPKFSNIIFPAI
jgi:hypothetical protein